VPAHPLNDASCACREDEIRPAKSVAHYVETAKPKIVIEKPEMGGLKDLLD
jgi:hypothetical protein